MKFIRYPFPQRLTCVGEFCADPTDGHEMLVGVRKPGWTTLRVEHSSQPIFE
jgi:hypothetical protein